MTTRELDSFQTNLLADLRQHVTTRTEASSPVVPLDMASSARRRRTRKLALVGGLAAACTAGAVVVPTMSAQPAYAVTAEPNGVVHVKINRLDDAPKLQAELKRQGINADIRYLPTDTECAPHRFTPMPSASDSATTYTVGSNGMDITIDRRDVPAGATVVISAAHVKDHGVNADMGIAKGKVPACTIVPVADTLASH